jgi:hypothetical protein
MWFPPPQFEGYTIVLKNDPHPIMLPGIWYLRLAALRDYQSDSTSAISLFNGIAFPHHTLFEPKTVPLNSQFLLEAAGTLRLFQFKDLMGHLMISCAGLSTPSRAGLFRSVRELSMIVVLTGWVIQILPLDGRLYSSSFIVIGSFRVGSCEQAHKVVLVLKRL